MFLSNSSHLRRNISFQRRHRLRSFNGFLCFTWMMLTENSVDLNSTPLLSCVSCPWETQKNFSHVLFFW